MTRYLDNVTPRVDFSKLVRIIGPRAAGGSRGEQGHHAVGRQLEALPGQVAGEAAHERVQDHGEPLFNPLTLWFTAHGPGTSRGRGGEHDRVVARRRGRPRRGRRQRLALRAVGRRLRRDRAGPGGRRARADRDDRRERRAVLQPRRAVRRLQAERARPRDGPPRLRGVHGGQIRGGGAVTATGAWVGGSRSTILDLLDRRLGSDPDGEYLDVCGTTVTAAEVAGHADRLAAGLTALGVGPGDRVATLLENSIEAALAWWGIVRCGAVPVNTAYKGEYLRHQLADSGAAVLIVASDLADRADAVVPRLDALDHVAVVPVGDEAPDGTADGSAPALAGATGHAWGDLLHAGGPAPEVAVRPGDLATFVYTGGTTGPSKGCMLSHNYHEALARQIGICWERTADDVVWTPLPLFHFSHRHGRARPAGLRGPRRHLPAVLGLELLARDEPHR